MLRNLRSLSRGSCATPFRSVVLKGSELKSMMQPHVAVVDSVSDSNSSKSVKSVQLWTAVPLVHCAGQWIDFFAPGIDKIGGFSITSVPPQDFSPINSGTLTIAVKRSPHPVAQWIHTSASIEQTEIQIRVGGSFCIFDDTISYPAGQNYALEMARQSKLPKLSDALKTSSLNFISAGIGSPDRRYFYVSHLCNNRSHPLHFDGGSAGSCVTTSSIECRTS